VKLFHFPPQPIFYYLNFKYQVDWLDRFDKEGPGSSSVVGGEGQETPSAVADGQVLSLGWENRAPSNRYVRCGGSAKLYFRFACSKRSFM